MFSDLNQKFNNKKNNKVSEHKHHRNRNIYDVFMGVLRLRKGVSIALTALFTLTASSAYASKQYYDVTIVDGDTTFEAYTPGATVSDILAENNITLTKYDVVTPSLDDYVKKSGTIVVSRLSKVTLTDGGITKDYYTNADTVKEFLDENDIVVNYHDIIDTELDAKITEDTSFEIVRVVKRIVEVNEDIPYDTETVVDTSMSISDSKIITPGENGVNCHSYEVVMRNGVEVSTQYISTTRVKEPVSEVKAIGISGGRVTQKTKDFSYSNVISCTATAYDLSFQSCGKRPGDRGYGITASGTYAKPGTVAVDPRVIPLGTRMYIESADGSFVYGYCVAEDTGGAIKGNKVDLFFNTNYECMQFGRRNVNVYILD